MGVQGLWKLLESTGRPVSLESLEGKILAVDVSLWLHQAMRGMRDDGGSVAANAHLHVLFNRVCKLLFYRIKPIFVFDGSVPELKRQTMVARRQKREIAAGKSKRTSEKMIKNYLQSHALHAVMGEAGGSQEKTAPRLKRTPAEPDMFELPPLPPAVLQESDSDSDDETNQRLDHLSRYQNLEEIDIDSESFKSLPPEVQHEMIVEMKEMRKRNSWKTMDLLPKGSTDFSDYQVKKLLQKGKMSKRMDDLRKEMSERNAGAIASVLDMESSQAHGMEAGRIMSEDSHHYLLVKRQSSTTEKEETKEAADEDTSTQDKATNSKMSLQTSSSNCEIDLKVKEDIPDDVKGQGSSQMPWEEDVIEIDDTEAEIDSSRAAEIAHIVKNFFQGQTVSVQSEEHSVKARAASSDTKEVIVLDNDDTLGHRSDGEVEIIQVDSHNRKIKASPKKSEKELFDEEEVIILESNNQTDSSFADRVQTVDQQKAGVVCDHAFLTIRAGQSTNNEPAASASSDKNSSTIKPHLSSSSELPANAEYRTDEQQLSKQATDEHSLQPRETLDKGITKDSPDVISIITDNGEERTAFASRGRISHQEDSVVVTVDAESENVAAGRTMGIREESSDDDDFVEVVNEPVSSVEEEGLFSASSLIPSAHLKEVISLDSSPSKTADIHPPVSSETRVDEEGAVIVSEDEVTRNEEGKMQLEEEVDDAEEDVEGMVEEEEDDEMESLREAARREWESMNVDDVPHLQESLETQRQMLQTERGRQERMAASVTDLMYAESKELLELFGIPYVVSPEEAEAQCAFLDVTNQTQGTITDDSDVWLFGGGTIYRNFFSKGKDVECFKSADVEKQLVLDRSKLITLAMLLGSDYTEGVKGIGWVTAMEVLTEFPGQGVEMLKALKSWWDATHKQLMPPVESQLKGKLRKLTLPASFPSQHVFDAYWHPVVDESTEEFSWQSPDLGLLRDFARDKLGWTKTKADEALLPVIKKLHETARQSKITSFFDQERNSSRQVTSKRLRRVLNRLHNPQAAEQDEGGKKKRRRQGGDGKMSKKETESKKRKRQGKGSSEEDFRPGALNPGSQNDVVSTDTCQDTDKDNKRIKRGGKGAKTRKRKEEAKDDSESSSQEYTVPKKITAQINSADAPSSSFRRSLRTSGKKVNYSASDDEQLPLAEFLEIEEAVSRKTEGISSSAQHGQNQREKQTFAPTFVGNLLTERQRENLSPSDTVMISTQLSRGTNQTEIQSNLVGFKNVRGQMGRGKGRAGLKGKGKAVGLKDTGGQRQGGPKLSESSSSDSDE